MNRLYIQDRITYKAESQREFTPEGYLKVPGRVAKSGTQEYLRRELGLDGNPNEIVVVYRPPEEVFSEKSLASYDGIDLTILHPKELVNAKNHKEVSVGIVKGSGRRDGDYVVVDMIFKNEEAISKIIRDGYVEQSGGYTAEYVAMDGVDPESGIAYKYVQRDILMNHVASLPVNTARAGRKARLFDQSHKPKGNTMNKVTLDSGRTVEIQDEAVALLVTDAIERFQKTIDAATKAKDEAVAESEKKQAKIDAMEEEAEKKKGETSDSIIAARIAQITEVKDKAKEIDAAYTADSIDPVAIMRGVLAVTRSTIDWKEKSDDYVSAAFDMAHESAKSGASSKSAEQKRQLAKDAAASASLPQNQVSAYQAHKTATSDAWKKSVQ